MAYTLTLTEEDWRTIEFVGGRYGWSKALLDHVRCAEGVEYRHLGGDHQIPEHKAWEIVEAFEQDCEGGHSLFPMLDPDSDLAAKLVRFMEGVV